MKRSSILSLVVALFICGQLAATPVSNIPLPGGFLNIDYSAGNGANTAYFVVDFAANGGQTHAFAYNFSGNTTAADGLLALESGGLNIATGSDPTFGLFINGMSYLGDSNTPSPQGNSFWEYFQGQYSSQAVAWTVPSSGISGFDNSGSPDPTQFLTNGEFLGFAVNTFDANFNSSDIPPRLPVAAAAAVPEPSALALAFVAGLAALAITRRGKRVV